MKSILGLVYMLLVVCQQRNCHVVLVNMLSKGIFRSLRLELDTSARLESNREDNDETYQALKITTSPNLVFRLKKHHIEDADGRSAPGSPPEQVQKGNQDHEGTDQHLHSRGGGNICCLPIPMVFNHRREKVHVHNADGSVVTMSPSRYAESGSYQYPYPYQYPQYPYPYHAVNPYAPNQQFLGYNHQRAYVATSAVLDGIDALNRHPPFTEDGHIDGKNLKKINKGFWGTLRKLVLWRYVHPVAPGAMKESGAKEPPASPNGKTAGDGKSIQRKDSNTSSKHRKRPSRPSKKASENDKT